MKIMKVIDLAQTADLNAGVYVWDHDVTMAAVAIIDGESVVIVVRHWGYILDALEARKIPRETARRMADKALKDGFVDIGTAQ